MTETAQKLTVKLSSLILIICALCASFTVHECSRHSGFTKAQPPVSDCARLLTEKFSSVSFRIYMCVSSLCFCINVETVCLSVCLLECLFTFEVSDCM